MLLLSLCCVFDLPSPDLCRRLPICAYLYVVPKGLYPQIDIRFVTGRTTTALNIIDCSKEQC
jgi:hypothetical protein